MASIWVFGDNVDTDQIVPGRYAPYMTSQEDLAKYPFIEARPEFVEQVQRGDVLVAGENFGCGSSREYAPHALTMVGVAAIVAPSFARIFFRNALNLGLPLFEADIRDQVHDRQDATVDLGRPGLQVAGRWIDLPSPAAWLREVWSEGGMIQYYLNHGRLPLEGDA